MEVYDSEGAAAIAIWWNLSEMAFWECVADRHKPSQSSEPLTWQHARAVHFGSRSGKRFLSFFHALKVVASAPSCIVLMALSNTRPNFSPLFHLRDAKLRLPSSGSMMTHRQETSNP
jgi:hypothetical protein